MLHGKWLLQEYYRRVWQQLLLGTQYRHLLVERVLLCGEPEINAFYYSGHYEIDYLFINTVGNNTYAGH